MTTKLPRLLVLNLVALHKELLGPNTPNLNRLIRNGSATEIEPVRPAVTCSAQSTYLTGTEPHDHGIVGNGWFFKELNEVKFWHQSNKLVQGEMIWEKAKKTWGEDFTCANLFWWYNMYNSADYSVTVRPMYPADGRKIPDIYCHDEKLREHLNTQLGRFPLFNFWGPTSSIVSSQWIANCAIEIEKLYSPKLSMVYLPHMDYSLQKFGPETPEVCKALSEIDEVVGQLMTMADEKGLEILILNEYCITKTERPIMLNQWLRTNGLIEVRTELGKELLDPGASEAFAVCDHQIAHLYIKDCKSVEAIKNDLKIRPGVKNIFTKLEQEKLGLCHPRSGDLYLEAENDSWFCYYYWLDENKAPDFARCVDIHRKPGYDPVELFFNPKKLFLKMRIMGKLLLKKMGFRQLMDFIPLTPKLVKGSHGSPNKYKPLIASSFQKNLQPMKATEIKNYIFDFFADGLEVAQKSQTPCNRNQTSNINNKPPAIQC